MEELIWVITNLQATDLLDVLLVAMLFFGASFLFRGTQATALLRGMLIIVVGLLIIAGLLRLEALGWLLTNALTVLAVAIPVIFQPELRRGLEQIGRGGQFLNKQIPDDTRTHVIHEIYETVEKLSERRHGALIVLQRYSSLMEYINTGISINSDVKTELLLTIFWPKTELHDGAVIIDDSGRIAAAAAILPPSNSRNLPDKNMGTRHRAAIGITEVGDAICVVVSEETGKISIASGGRLVPLSIDKFSQVLTAIYGPEEHKSQTLRERLQQVMARFQKPSIEQNRTQV